MNLHLKDFYARDGWFYNGLVLPVVWEFSAKTVKPIIETEDSKTLSNRKDTQIIW